MKYDDASWHYGGDFPADLAPEAGATHIGMFVTWALLAGLAGEIHLDEGSDGISRLESRAVTPGQFFLEACDEKFTDEDLSDDGNAFAKAYYDLSSGAFLADYEETAGGDLPSLYHVPDTWETFDRLKPVFDRRYREWRGDA